MGKGLGLGVGKLLCVETVKYRFPAYMNDTLRIDAATKVKMKALRLVTMPNRMVLDQMTLTQGWVCVLMGTSCCTFIPENDEDGQIISQTLHNLTMLCDANLLENVTDAHGNFWWFLNSWRHWLLLAGVAIWTGSVVYWLRLHHAFDKTVVYSNDRSICRVTDAGSG